jgi:hypothetical protein
MLYIYSTPMLSVGVQSARTQMTEPDRTIRTQPIQPDRTKSVTI